MVAATLGDLCLMPQRHYPFHALEKSTNSFG
jgi:hypothetical protein